MVKYCLLIMCLLVQGTNIVLAQESRAEYLILFPVGNEMETESDGGLHYHNFEWERGADALDFDTYRTGDSAQLGRFLTVAREKGSAADPLPVRLELLDVWQVDSLLPAGQRLARKMRNRRFLREVRKIVGDGLEIGKERAERPYSGPGGGRVYSGIIPVTYRDEPCLLLWDEAARCTKAWATEVADNAPLLQFPGQEPRVSGSRYLQYAFDYSFRGMRQLALCRRTEGGYVLLFLTRQLIPLEE